ncbi:MAG: TIGR04551 family protein [Myxococcales bacterium]|nr:TIGR04551 family protein [Myxococcales bacterium]
MSLRRIAPLLALAPALSVLLASPAALADDPPATPAPSSTEPKPEVAEPKKPDLIPASKEPEKEPEAKADPKAAGAKPAEAKGDVQSDEWWTHTRPIVEIHGFFRTRGEVFHNFSLGRVDPPTTNNRLFPRPIGDSYVQQPGGNTVATYGCGPTDNPGAGAANQVNAPTLTPCSDKTHASANLRFRIDPEIHISDNVRILSQIDLLDNVVLGSTPDGYSNKIDKEGNHVYVGRGGYIPLLAFSSSQVPPTAGVNSWTNSIAVKRAWAEVLLPNIGQIRFGRMPNQWGLGILANSGDTIDSDYQSTADRIMFATGIRSLDLYFAGAWDFPNSGKTSQTLFDQQGQPYNVSQLANTNQWMLSVFRRLKPEQLRARLAKGDTVVQGGIFAVYRQQLFSTESSEAMGLSTATDTTYQSKLVRLGAKAFIGSGWFQVRTRRLRWETELVYIYGSIENPRGVENGTYTREDYKIRQFGGASELEYKALNDDLTLRFHTGLATGDQGVETLAPGNSGLQPRVTDDKTISTFRFHPDYRIDLILFRNILSRVQGAYYFKPGVQYDFARSPDGERFGGRADIIYSRASKFVQTPGHKEDLGVELDFSLYYQSRDGSLNDDPSKIGGFYAMLQYGVLFPLGGLGYMQSPGFVAPEISSAQIVRLYLGVVY